MHRQIDWKTIKWSLGVGALAAVLFGCAGNSVTAAVTTSTTATTTGGVFPDVAGVNLSDTPASMQYVFLTGAGRQGLGETKVTTLRNLIATDILGQVTSGLTQKILTLTSYQSQILATNVDLNGQQSRNFNTVELNAINFTQTDSNGTQSFTAINNIPNDIPTAVRVYKGRQTQIPVFLDPDTFITQDVTVNGVTTTQAFFDPNWFTTINEAQGDNIAVRGFLSDYVCFNVSGISAGNLPSLSQNNGVANRIFFSGDGYAIATGDPANGGSTGAPFELILPAGQSASVIGHYSAPTSLGGAITPGTYTTLNVDPSDVTTTDPVLARKITSFQGEWKDHFKERVNPLTGLVEDLGYLKSVHPFEAVSIPTSLDDERQQVVMFTENVTTNADTTKSATVTSLMWGYLDLATQKIFVYPIKNITDPNALTNRIGEVAGTLGTMYTATGATTLSPQQMRFVSFTLTNPPAGFPTTGKVVVLRK